MRDHECWLDVAKRDLNAAKILCKGESFPSATYHCQQAAEKALKAYLVFQDQEIVRTHDLFKLCDMCQKFDKGFQRLETEIKMLNPFATKFRYPSEFDLPDLCETKLAITQATTIVKLVVEKLSKPISNQIKIC